MKHSMDREFAIRILSEIGDFLGCFSLEIKSDREIVKEAIKNSRNKVVLEFVPEEFKRDKEIVKVAVMQNGSSLNYTASNLLFDKEIVLEALKSKKGDAFQFIPYELKQDREFILEMISTRNRGIRFPSKFSNDREIVLESVKINGLLLEFASKELKSDKEIVLEAVKNHKNASCYAGESLQGVVIDSFTNRFDKFGKVLNTEPEFLMNFPNNRNFSWENDSNSDEYSTEDEFDEKVDEFDINEEKEENRLPYQYFPYNLKKDRGITLQAIKKENNVFKYIPRKLLTQDRIIALELVKRNGMNLSLLCYKFRSDRQVISEAIKQNRQALRHVPYLLRNEFN